MLMKLSDGCESGKTCSKVQPLACLGYIHTTTFLFQNCPQKNVTERKSHDQEAAGLAALFAENTKED